MVYKKEAGWSNPFFETKHIVLLAANAVKLATLEEWDLRRYLLMELQQMKSCVQKGNA